MDLMDLKYRVDLMKEENIITQEVYDSLLKVIDIFKNDYEIILTEENGQMMITHLAMAIMRIKNNQPVNGINSEVYEEVTESEHFSKAREIYNKLKKVLDLEMPEAEEKYMLVNVTMILERVSDEKNDLDECAG